MKVFVTGKAGEEDIARKTMESLKSAGHEITFDWTTIPHLKPYEDNVETSREAAVLEAKGVMNADALVLLVHEKGVGMYVELGMAIAAKKPIFALGHITPTMFLFHPMVRRVGTTLELLDALSQLSASGGKAN